jgi:hypothetical protein
MVWTVVRSLGWFGYGSVVGLPLSVVLGGGYDRPSDAAGS